MQGKRGFSFCSVVGIAVVAILICILTMTASQVHAPPATFNLNPGPDPDADLSRLHRHISAIYLSAIGVAIADLTVLLPCDLIPKSPPLVL